MNVNYNTMTIEMTTAEAKAAGKVGSVDYKNLVQTRSDFPNFQIVIKKAVTKRDTYKGLTYNYMAHYIKSHNKELLVEYELLRGYENGKKVEFAEAASYGEVKAWFLLKFPEIEEFNKRIADLRNTNREAIEEKKYA